MKIHEYLGLVVSYGAFVQFIKWILDSLNFQENSIGLLSFLFSNVFALLSISIFLVYQMQKEHNVIKKLLKKEGILKEEKEGFMANVIGKRGEIDARALLVIIALLLIYLMWKAGKLPF